MRCSKSCYLHDLELAGLSGNAVIRQVSLQGGIPYAYYYAEYRHYGTY